MTQISVYGRPASTIRSVTATGSVSGGHSGEIKPYSDTSGASFMPDTPFTPGETVSVMVDVTQRPRVNYSFTVGRLIPNAAIPALNLTATQPAKLEHFVTRPDLLPPKITVSVSNPREKSNIFLTPLPSPTVHPGGPQLITLSPVGPGGPLMLDNQGRARWFKQLPSNVMASVLRARPLQERARLDLVGGHREGLGLRRR